MFLKLLTLFSIFLIGCNASWSPLNQISTELDDDDAAFKNYLTHVMSNYSSWLRRTLRDPFNTPNVIYLNGTKVLGNVDVELEIANQTMQGQGRTVGDVIIANTFLGDNAFVVGRSSSQDTIYFRGDYSIKTGFYYAPDSQILPFVGQGKWTLATSAFSEALTIIHFNLTEDGFIDLSEAFQSWTNAPQWTEIRFEGLSVTGEMEGDRETVSRALTQVFSTFLLGTDLKTRDLVPPLQLFLQYMEETVEKTKLEDIISNWKSTTTTPHQPSKGLTLQTFPFLILFLVVIYNLKFTFYIY